ncbi:MAG: 1-acyl-sn-glycerol-3-phosphate acyltransferase [Flavobacteriaceae bacterium]|nr:1-acyl-sn-glycerol-3-phosphate acyltransferase [Flavobacteriaceae bacterium]
MVILCYDKRFYSAFYKVGRFWARAILICSGFMIKKKDAENLKYDGIAIIIANHTSLVDIFMMLSLSKKPTVFVGKKELAKYPLFGYFVRRTNILVDRSDIQSKKNVYDQVREKIKLGHNIVIFPEGLVPDDESIVLSPFKNGAFSMAIEHKLPILAMSMYDNKRHFSYTFFSGGPGNIRVKIHPLYTNHIDSDIKKNELNKYFYNLIYSDLVINA